MKIEKIDHICILVKDMEKAVKFFTDLFETEFTSLGKSRDTDVRSMIDATGIEIMEPLLPDGKMAQSLERRGRGYGLFR